MVYHLPVSSVHKELLRKKLINIQFEPHVKMVCVRLVNQKEICKATFFVDLHCRICQVFLETYM